MHVDKFKLLNIRKIGRPQNFFNEAVGDTLQKSVTDI